MKDYTLYVAAAWGFAAVVLIVLFVQSWRRLADAEGKDRNAQKG